MDADFSIKRSMNTLHIYKDSLERLVIILNSLRLINLHNKGSVTQQACNFILSAGPTLPEQRITVFSLVDSGGNKGMQPLLLLLLPPFLCSVHFIGNYDLGLWDVPLKPSLSPTASNCLHIKLGIVEPLQLRQAGKARVWTGVRLA